MICVFVVIFSPPVRNDKEKTTIKQTLCGHYANEQKIFDGWLKDKLNGA